jgi:hypothetical protein
MTTLLIPLLMDRGISPSVAALTLAALGLAQLPGVCGCCVRRSRMRNSTAHATDHPAVHRAAGCRDRAATLSRRDQCRAIRFGRGLQTLARPWLVQQLYGVVDAGRWNGEVARMRGIARAAGRWLQQPRRYWLAPLVLAGVGGLLALTVPLARGCPSRCRIGATPPATKPPQARFAHSP